MNLPTSSLLRIHNPNIRAVDIFPRVAFAPEWEDDRMIWPAVGFVRLPFGRWLTFRPSGKIALHRSIVDADAAACLGE